MRWFRGLGKRGMAGVGVACVLGAAVAVWFAVGRDASSASADPAGPSWTQAQADDLAGALVAQEPGVVARALSSEAAAVYGQDPAPIIPAGSTLVIDAGTFEQTSDEDAVVVGALDGQQVLLLLVEEDDRWVLLTTVGA